MKLIKIFIFALTIAGSTATMFLLTGCETAKGFGKDVEDTGQSIQHEAQ